jgi:hypothetical protein
VRPQGAPTAAVSSNGLLAGAATRVAAIAVLTRPDQLGVGSTEVDEAVPFHDKKSRGKPGGRRRQRNRPRVGAAVAY